MSECKNCGASDNSGASDNNSVCPYCGDYAVQIPEDIIFLSISEARVKMGLQMIPDKT
jgi:predicted Zn-ribbon and HTH transcriptional regulator